MGAEVSRPAGTGLTCGTCGQTFSSTAEQRTHFKTDWHRLNVQRKARGLVSTLAASWPSHSKA